MEILDQSETRKYELGFLLSPYVPADSILETAEAEVFSHIAKMGGEVTKTINPVMRPLAYQIKKRIGHKQTAYKDAYFGSVFFSLPADQAPGLIEVLQKSELIIRHLLIIAPDYTAGKKGASRPTVATASPTPTDSKTPVTDEKKVEAEPVDTKEIDKEIEDLLTTA